MLYNIDGLLQCPSCLTVRPVFTENTSWTYPGLFLPAPREMTGRIQDGRVVKSPHKSRRQTQSLRRNTSTSLQKAYTFHPTEQNRRTVPENKAPYRFNFGPWCGSTIEDLVYYGPQQYAGKRYLLTFILSENFDLKSKVDLITAFRSLGDSFYQDLFCVGQRITERGFTRTWRHGSHFHCNRFSEGRRVLLSCDETKYDQFIHVSGPRPSDWDRAENAKYWGGERRPDVTMDAAAFNETIFNDLDEAERENLAQFPVHISFHGMPIRLERLFIDDPENKATYLTIAPLGFEGSAGGQDIYLTMRLNEQGQDEDWAEKLLGIPITSSAPMLIARRRILRVSKSSLSKRAISRAGFVLKPMVTSCHRQRSLPASS